MPGMPVIPHATMNPGLPVQGFQAMQMPPMQPYASAPFQPSPATFTTPVQPSSSHRVTPKRDLITTVFVGKIPKTADNIFMQSLLEVGAPEVFISLIFDSYVDPFPTGDVWKIL